MLGILSSGLGGYRSLDHRFPTLAAGLKLTIFSAPTEPGEIGVAWSRLASGDDRLRNPFPGVLITRQALNPPLAKNPRSGSKSTVRAQSEGARHGAGWELEGRIPRARIPQRHRFEGMAGQAAHRGGFGAGAADHRPAPSLLGHSAAGALSPA